jgi:hypothetical protein
MTCYHTKKLTLERNAQEKYSHKWIFEEKNKFSRCLSQCIWGSTIDSVKQGEYMLYKERLQATFEHIYVQKEIPVK